MAQVFQYIFSGLSSGCIFALIALGFVIIARVTGVYNFAQGQYMMVGGMVMASTHTDKFPIAASVVLSVVVVALVAVLQERFTVSIVRDKVGVVGLAVISLGVGVLLEGLALIVWGKNARSIPSFEPGTFTLLGAHLDNQTLWIWGATLVSLVLMLVLFQRTTLGKAMRACALNPTAARLLGIRLDRMAILAFAIGGGLAGLVGAIALPLTSVSWESGVTVGLVGFIAAAVAGFDRPAVAVAAGLGLGVVENVAAGEISSSYRQLFVYGVLLVYLLVRDVLGEGGFVARVRLARASGGLRQRRRLRRAVSAGAGHVALARASGDRMRREPRWAMLLPLVLLTLMALAPLVLESGSQAMSAAIVILLSAVAATGLTLILGLGRMFSLGHAGLVLISGYTVAILTVNHAWNPWVALAVGVLLAVVGAFIIGWLTLRLQGFNLAIATLAIHLILLVFVTQATSFTGGERGIVGVPALKVFSLTTESQHDFYWITFVALLICLLVARNLTKSRVGRSLRAVGSEQDGASMLGVNAFRMKLMVFVIGGAMAGLAGGLWVFYLSLAAPENWGFALTISLVTYVVVGGLTNVYGGVVGAVVVGAVQYLVTSQTAGLGESSSEYEVLLNGAFLIIFLLIFRQGIAVALSVERVKGYVARIRRGKGALRGPTEGGPSAGPMVQTGTAGSAVAGASR